MANDKVNILIVDDLPEKLLVLESILAELGENLVTARSGLAALQQVLQQEFAVILLDVFMPDMDGFETAALIRKRKKTAQVPIIFITGHADEMLTAQGYSLGAVDCILAPVVPDILRSKVKVFVDLFRMTQQVKRQAEERIALMQEQAARLAAEESNQRLAFLARAGTVLGRSLDPETTARDAARLAVPFLADMSAVSLAGPVEGDWTTVLARSASDEAPILEDLRGREALPSELAALIGRVLETGATVSVPGDSDSLPPDIAAVLVLPLQARNHTVGALTLAHQASHRRFATADISLAENLASRAAIALDNALLYGDVQQADRQKNEFLSMLAHELRNPLAPIRNAVQILRLRGQDQPELQWSRDVIERQVGQLVRLVDDLLDVSRITQGKIRLQMEPVEIQSIVAQAVETSHPLIDSRKHQLTVTMPPEPLWVRGDGIRLAQVVTNLLNNSAKYTDEGGRIELTVEAEAMRGLSPIRPAGLGLPPYAEAPTYLTAIALTSTASAGSANAPVTGEAVIRVRDTGVGIPPTMLSSIFDLFTQVDRSLDRSQGGLGIGLTLVRHLVKMHGGSVRASSAGPNQGSEFVIRLPLLPAPAPVATNGTITAPIAGSPCRIMVVDDNRDAAMSLAILLRLDGYEVRAVHDGPAALELAQTFAPNVILLDIGLPEMDGYEVARRLRQDPVTAGAFLVAVTGYSQEVNRLRSREAGFDHYLVKPVDPDVLPALLAERFQPAADNAANACSPICS